MTQTMNTPPFAKPARPAHTAGAATSSAARTVVPLRSLLFVPGHRVDRYEKAYSSGADAIVIDLEDAVPYDRRQEARAAAAEFIAAKAGSSGAKIFARANGAGSGELLADLLALGATEIDGFMLAKATAASTRFASDVLDELAAAAATSPHPELMPLPETADGIFYASDTCAASDRVTRLCIGFPGGGDVARAAGIIETPGRLESQALKSHVALAARAAGVTEVYGGFVLQVDDSQRLAEEIELSRSFGYTGMVVLHPRQVAPVNQAFSPDPAAVAEADEIMHLMADAVTRGEAAVRYKNRFIDYANVRTSLEVLIRATAFGLYDGTIPDLEIK
jgi:citrate lyase subunit beta/citryl-CoA lyase